MNVSLDGFVETPDHSLDWVNIDKELHSWFNDLARGQDAFLYGRGMYETMSAYWPTAADGPGAAAVQVDFARVWNARPKIVFSSTLSAVDFNSRLVRGAPEIELTRLRHEFNGELGVGGANLAAEFIRRGLVDTYHLVVHPVVIGGGTPFFPSLERPLPLRLVETRRFASGAMLLTYGPTRSEVER